MMKPIKVSKLGAKIRGVYLPREEYTYGEIVALKPSKSPHRIYVRVSKMGDKLIAIIPKLHWEFFPHRCEVYITQKTEWGSGK